MSSTYTPILRAELIGPGDQAGNWGTTTNNTFQFVFESAIAGMVTVPVVPDGSNNCVLTYVNGASTTATLDESIYAILQLLPGTSAANYNVFCPPVSKTYIVWNNTAYAATFYNSGTLGNTIPGGSGVVVPAGAKSLIWSDGVNCTYTSTIPGSLTVAGNASVLGGLTVTSSLTAASANLASPLAITSGGTSSSTATGTGSVVLANSPTLTGVPNVPTAGYGTNTAQIANTAFVNNALSALGTMATQNSSAVNITGGSITGNYNLNAATATIASNGGVTSVNGLTGAVTLSTGVGGTGTSWHGVSRAFNTLYTNSRSYPIAVSASTTCSTGSSIYGYVNGQLVSFFQWQFNGCGAFGGCFMIVPAGASYQLNSTQGVYNWAELY